MGFRYSRRVKLAGGLGLNLSKSGISTSYRTRYGSIGPKGFSVRTGIPGLSYRGGKGKAGEAAIVFLLVVLAYYAVVVAAVVAWHLLRFAFWAAIEICHFALWLGAELFGLSYRASAQLYGFAKRKRLEYAEAKALRVDRNSTQILLGARDNDEQRKS